MTDPYGELLGSVPDVGKPDRIAAWATGTIADLAAYKFDPSSRASFTDISAAAIFRDAPVLVSRFVNAAFFADWVCYTAEADRVDYERLSAVIAAFPSGFRVWFCNMQYYGWTPVAYTGWYPISQAVFKKAYERPWELRHRGELKPSESVAQDGSYVWLFNYSIISQLRKTEQSRRMLQRYARDLEEINALGLAAAVLSEESKAVVKRFGMTYRGDMTHAGVSENVYATNRLLEMR